MIAILGRRRSLRIARARTLATALDATDLVEHYTSRSRSLFWVPAPHGDLSLAVIERNSADGRWTVWMQPRALGLRKEWDWQFKNKTMAVAWTACAILVGLRKARELLE